jgi:hypothetical protein
MWLQVFLVRHDVLATCHFEFNKTMELMFWDYWWPQLWKYVEELSNLVMFVLKQKIFVITLVISFNHYQSMHPYGLQFPYFIINLSPFSSYKSILVVVDHLMKMVNFILCTKTITSEKTSKLFFDHDFQYHGLPQNIIFDHGF